MENNTPTLKPYTANQPLMLGGQIYMWNRYHQAKTLVHMNEAQYTITGHQARIELLDGSSNPVRFICSLSDRAFKPLNQVYLTSPKVVVSRLIKLINTIYGVKANTQLAIDVIDMFASCCEADLATINSSVTNIIYSYMFHGEPEYRTIDSTDLVPVRPYDASEWLARLGSAIDCTQYISGKVAADAYIKRDVFASHGISVEVQDYKMPPYKLNKRGVLGTNAMVSILDPLLRLGVGATRQLIANSAEVCNE